MSAVCDIALVLGLTFSGLCLPPPEPEPPAALPEDQPTAWAIPAPPPPPPPPVVRPATVAMPPVVITKVIQLPAPASPPPPQPPPAPPPDPYRLAAQRLWDSRMRPSLKGQMAVFQPGRPPTMPLPRPSEPTAPEPKPDYEGDRRVSTLPVDNSRIVTTDRYITGVLETGINSQLDGSKGSIVIQVARDVYGYHGRNLLIPKGSRMVCDYESPDKIGSSRLGITCNRILIAEHRAEIIELASAGGDVQGRAGFTGEVDNRFGERYGTALMLTAISSAVRLATASATSNDESSTIAAATDAGAEEMSTRFGEITASVLEQTVDLAPIITVPQGTRVQIRPANDWYIREVTS
ncbi:TrbI/VirB10 family protein [Rhodospirillum sp. A1_3_36]|uniref:TrbI/VirB10 family protein n=1 Tax=Rhodospirillum sp. A1_3_36 TaxID=3391666 RepID=UPI0039A4967C